MKGCFVTTIVNFYTQEHVAESEEKIKERNPQYEHRLLLHLQQL
jgi:hypothetical protein